VKYTKEVPVTEESYRPSLTPNFVPEKTPYIYVYTSPITPAVHSAHHPINSSPSKILIPAYNTLSEAAELGFPSHQHISSGSISWRFAIATTDGYGANAVCSQLLKCFSCCSSGLDPLAGCKSTIVPTTCLRSNRGPLRQSCRLGRSQSLYREVGGEGTRMGELVRFPEA
jgi:hypothetical protein